MDVVELLRRLVEAKSYSGEEELAANVLQQAMQSAGCNVERLGNNVVCTKGRGERGLLFNSHLDTVPASSAWTRDPWQAEVVGDRMYGLGTTDAKSCVAAMAAAFVAAADPDSRGRLVFAATVNEEGGDPTQPSGLEQVLPELGELAGGIVGEPTILRICNAQRGLVRLRLHLRGKAAHASRPWEGTNAIDLAADAVIALRQLAEDMAEVGIDTALGQPTLQVTMIAGGTASNVIPDRCTLTVDVRTTRLFDNDLVLDRIRSSVDAEVDVQTRRYVPVVTEADERIVRTARQALPEAEMVPFGGASDLVFLAISGAIPVPAILLGPGNGRQSHNADEFVDLSMVHKAVAAYGSIASGFWEG